MVYSIRGETTESFKNRLAEISSGLDQGKLLEISDDGGGEGRFLSVIDRIDVSRNLRGDIPKELRKENILAFLTRWVNANLLSASGEIKTLRSIQNHKGYWGDYFKIAQIQFSQTVNMVNFPPRVSKQSGFPGLDETGQHASSSEELKEKDSEIYLLNCKDQQTVELRKCDVKLFSEMRNFQRLDLTAYSYSAVNLFKKILCGQNIFFENLITYLECYALANLLGFPIIKARCTSTLAHLFVEDANVLKEASNVIQILCQPCLPEHLFTKDDRHELILNTILAIDPRKSDCIPDDICTTLNSYRNFPKNLHMDDSGLLLAMLAFNIIFNKKLDTPQPVNILKLFLEKYKNDSTQPLESETDFWKEALYLLGADSEKNEKYETALECYIDSAQLKCGAAYQALGKLYLRDPSKKSNAIFAFQKAATFGFPGAFLEVGKIYESEKSEKAVESFYHAGCSGDPEGFLFLGNLFNKSTVAPNDSVKAISWWKVSSHVNAIAKALIAECCFNGQDVEQDIPLAAQLASEAVKENVPLGFRVLAQCYVLSPTLKSKIKLKRNFRSMHSMDLMDHAAKKGDAVALRIMGQYRYTQADIEEDLIPAKNDLEQAAKLGDKEAQTLLDEWFT
jgi:TPR repeat protein